MTEVKVLKGNGQTKGGLDSDLVEHRPIICTQLGLLRTLPDIKQSGKEF